jgi:hypothetical protein
MTSGHCGVNTGLDSSILSLLRVVDNTLTTSTFRFPTVVCFFFLNVYLNVGNGSIRGVLDEACLLSHSLTCAKQRSTSTTAIEHSVVNHE